MKPDSVSSCSSHDRRSLINFAEALCFPFFFFHKGAGCLFLFFLSLAFSTDICSSAVVPESAIKSFLEREVTRSALYPFTVVSTNPLVNIDILKWAEKMSSEIIRISGHEITFSGSRDFRIVVKEPASEERATAYSVVEMANQKIVMGLIIEGYDRVRLDLVRRHFCRLFFLNHIMERIDNVSFNNLAEVAGKKEVPEWLIRGLSYEISSAKKKEQMQQTTLVKWEQGMVPGVRGFLKSTEYQTAPENEDVVWSFFRWILSLDDKKRLFDRIFERLAAGNEISASWLANVLAGGLEIEELERKWESFLLTNRRVIYAPGRLTLGGLRELEGKLLLYRGSSGIPLDSKIKNGSTFLLLIKLRDEAWIPLFVKSRSMSLRLTSVGRGKAFKETTRSYCRFLRALTEEHDETRLILFLKDAEGKLDELRKETELMSGVDDDGQVDSGIIRNQDAGHADE